MGKINEMIDLSYEEAKSVYNNGGPITIKYVFMSPERGSLNREAVFTYTDCGLSFEGVVGLYKTDMIRDVSYSTSMDSYNASKMCNLMCN